MSGSGVEVSSQGSKCALEHFAEFSFITRYSTELPIAKGMTTDVYPRENCIAPDIAFIVK